MSTVTQISDESKSFDNRRNYIAPFDHRTDANVAAREILGDRPNDIVPNHVSDSSDVLRGQRVFVHERVHRRVNVCRRRRGQRPQQRCLCSGRRGGDELGTRYWMGYKELTTRLSQIPLAILARVLAEHGAMSTTSAQRRSSMCRMGSPMR
jgi:hypothetical protein